MVEKMREIDEGAPGKRRLLHKRLIGNFRDFSVLLTAVLRTKGIPAQARCGFSTYFNPMFEDHWVVECWEDDNDRWRMVDPQLDDFQREELNIDFDSDDMPAGQFLTGAQAWRLVRAQKEDPEDFGIFDMRGLRFIWATCCAIWPP